MQWDEERVNLVRAHIDRRLREAALARQVPGRRRRPLRRVVGRALVRLGSHLAAEPLPKLA